MVSQHALQVSRLTPGGVEESGQGGLQAHIQGGVWLVGGVCSPTPGGVSPGSNLGVSRPKPGGLQAHTGVGVGCVSQHALRQTPTSRWLLLWAVCILLECILVCVMRSLLICGNMWERNVFTGVCHSVHGGRGGDRYHMHHGICHMVDKPPLALWTYPPQPLLDIPILGPTPPGHTHFP